MNSRGVKPQHRAGHRSSEQLRLRHEAARESLLSASPSAVLPVQIQGKELIALTHQDPELKFHPSLPPKNVLIQKVLKLTAGPQLCGPALKNKWTHKVKYPATAFLCLGHHLLAMQKSLQHWKITEGV